VTTPLELLCYPFANFDMNRQTARAARAYKQALGDATCQRDDGMKLPMSPELSSAPTTYQAGFSMKEAPFIVPALLPVCCVCGLIRDERGASLGLAPWLTPQIYRDTHGIEPNDSSLTHTYVRPVSSRSGKQARSAPHRSENPYDTTQHIQSGTGSSERLASQGIGST